MKKFAVIFRHDNDRKPELIEYDNEDESFSWKETLRLKEDRGIEGGKVGIWFKTLLKPEFYATLICDDKPCYQCAADGDTDHNGWHTRMFSDFALIVDTKEQAKKILKSPTPMAWWQ